MLTRLSTRRSSRISAVQTSDVIHDIGGNRFKLIARNGSDIAYLDYHIVFKNSKHAVDFYHTFTIPESQGLGLAGKVVTAALDWAKKNEYVVIPSCSYVAAFINKNSEWMVLFELMSDAPDFWFPGSPYSVQTQFMTKAYSAISNGGICVLESPTGTGKSLSLICASLAWLRDNRALAISKRMLLQEDLCDPDIPAWVKRQTEMNAIENAEEIISKWAEFKANMRAKSGRVGVISCNSMMIESKLCGTKRKLPEFQETEESVEDDEYLAKDETGVGELCFETTSTDRRVKVIIASRTHSQISQLFKEINKTKYKDIFNVITLGSRSQLCVNPRIPKGVSTKVVNDLCRRLVDDSKCEFRKSTSKLTQLIISSPMDVEDLYSAGRSTLTTGCPYYATREMEPFADVLLVPHSSLANSTTRAALGIDLADNLVVIDEAHSILDLINSSRSVSLPLGELERILPILSTYLNRYATRLCPKNLVSIKQLQFLCNRLSKYVRSIDTTSTLISIERFMETSRLASMDMASVLILLDSNQFSRKFTGFSRSISDTGSDSSSIYTVQSFLLALHSSSESDRVYVKHAENECVSLEFVAIDAESELASIAKSAKALLLVSGTLKPFNEYEAVSALAECPFDTFAGRYIVGTSRLFSRVVCTTQSGVELTYNSKGRSRGDHLAAILEVLQICIDSNPQGGIVIFTSSYGYCAEVATYFRQMGIDKRLPLLVDSPKARVGELLSEYSGLVRSGGNAVLLSVVNGSLSEGIDFKDCLCRCVIVVGLPYSNPADPVMSERMSFFDSRHSTLAKFPTGQTYYENKCIKAVNQAIGRSIRHSEDWSAIVLIDSRYNRPKTFQGISDWVRNVTKVASNFSEFRTELYDFYFGNTQKLNRP